MKNKPEHLTFPCRCRIVRSNPISENDPPERFGEYVSVLRPSASHNNYWETKPENDLAIIQIWPDDWLEYMG